MSKIDISGVKTTHTGEAKGCGCGGHARHGKRRAEPRAADESDTPKHGVREGQPALESEQGSGCCGGSKARK